MQQIDLFDMVRFDDFLDTTVCEFTGRRTIDYSRDNILVILEKYNEIFTVINQLIENQK